MSSITALFHVVDHMRTNGGDIAEACRIVPYTTSDRAPHDYEGAIALGRYIARDQDVENIPRALRELLSRLVEAEQPGWLSAVQTGRDSVRTLLTPNVLEVFTQAELFEPAPSVEVVEWWDRLAAPAWASTNPELLARGREAERRSFESERERLVSEKCPNSAKWISLDDNTAGFDIASWVDEGSRWVPLLIEVKSTVKSTPVFHLSRNEYDTAASVRSHYLVHVWVQGELHTFERDAIVAAAPADGTYSRWENAIFRLM